MLLRNAKDLKPELEKFYNKTKKAVLVEECAILKTAVLTEEDTVIAEGGYHPIIIHFFGDSKTILAKSITLAGATIPSDNALGFPENKFYVLSADNMNDNDITALLESSEHTKLDWFTEQKELNDSLLLNNILFEKKTLN